MAALRPMIWTALVVFVLDQLTKLVVVQWLDLKTRHVIDVMSPFVTFRMAWNKGVNFGIGAGYDLRWVLIGVAIAISVGVLIWLWRSGGTEGCRSPHGRSPRCGCWGRAAQR